MRKLSQKWQTRLDISMPISSEIWAIISGAKSAHAALETLLSRAPFAEGT